MTHNTSGDSVDRHEHYLLPFPDKKVSEVSVIGMPNTSTFYFLGEDHTMGNMLHSRLVKSKHVIYAGYRVPRPDEAKMELRVQTDGTTTPREEVLRLSRELVHHMDLLMKRFLLEWELKKAANAAAARKGGARAAGEGGADNNGSNNSGGEDEEPNGEVIKNEVASPKGYGWVMGD